MKRILAAAAALLAFFGPARATGYDDFTAGMTADLRGENERAIEFFTAALEASDLAPVYRPAAFRGRASSYLQLDKCQEAMADIKAFEALRKPDMSLIRLRVGANLCLKNAKDARSDIDLLSKGKLDWADLWAVARMEWRYGLYDVAAGAARDSFGKADKKEYSSSYVLLWQFLNEHRASTFDAAKAARQLAELKYAGWPRPVFDLYLGKSGADALLSKASSSFWETTKLSQTCEAKFYLAEWQLSRGEAEPAKGLLQDVVKDCPIEFLERSAAKTELKRLGVPVAKED